MKNEKTIDDKKKLVETEKKYAWHSLSATVIVFVILGLMLTERIVYLLKASANVPMMDYWGYIVQFVEKLMNEGVSLADLWAPQITSGSHRSGLATLLFLFNVKYLGYNVQIEIILGAIGALINCLFLYWIFAKKSKWSSKYALLGFVPLALCVFNINQWEILVLEFSFGFSLRILVVLISLYIFDAIQHKEKKYWMLAIYMIFMVLVAFITGSYGPAIVGALVFVTICQIIVEKEYRWKKFIQNVCVIVAISIGLVIFFCGLTSTGGSGASSFFIMIKDGTLVKGVMMMLGSSILHIGSPFVAQHSNALVCVGAVLFLLYMIAVILFFYRKMYTETYMPILMMAYTACIILVISYGRISAFGLSYVTSSRYVCETTLGLVGVFWIYWYEIQMSVSHKNQSFTKKCFLWFRKIICIIAICSVVGAIGYSYQVENSIAPYRKAYGESLIDILTENEKLTAEQAAKFQASTPFVNQGLEIMRKYHLGIFNEKQ